jgi:hypothetical protein
VGNTCLGLAFLFPTRMGKGTADPVKICDFEISGPFGFADRPMDIGYESQL